MTPGRSILAVVVLYRMPADQSPSFTSLSQQLQDNPQAAAAIDLIVCDNTPTEQSTPAGFDGLYVRFPDNPGLARCYNLALQVAQERGLPWLLLLDQDTHLTAAFVQELIAATTEYGSSPHIAAIVPKLAQRESIISPHFPPSLGPPAAVPADAAGIWSTRLHVFNSGSTLRVATLLALGGFPLAYPLDYLDHATFTRLQNHGGKVAILQSILTHDLSTNDTASPVVQNVPRHLGILDAEYRFYNDYGTPQDRLLRRLRLVRAAAGRIVRGQSWDHSRRLLASAFRI